MGIKYLCEGLESYLSEEAASVVDTLVNAGLDKDIAFEMVASDETAFDLPPRLQQLPINEEEL